jgi:hypothetical protein
MSMIYDPPLTAEQQAELEEAKEIGRELVNGIKWSLKMARGEVPRPEKSLWEKMEELQREIDAGDFSYEED